MSGFLYRWFNLQNERGFILPLTLIITFLLFSFLLHEIKIYETEKRFLHHQEDMLVMDRLLQMASVDLKKELSLQSAGGSSIISYKNGTIRYSKMDFPKGVNFDPHKVIYLRLTAKTKNNDGSRHISYVYYDKNKQKIIRWVEAK